MPETKSARPDKPLKRKAYEKERLRLQAELYPGDEPYTLAPKISVVPIASLVTRDVAALLGRSRRVRATGRALGAPGPSNSA